MQPLQDYMYRFPHESTRIFGRCRVRIYTRKKSAHTVLLTEVSNSGETITTACTRIASDLTARWKLNPKTTQWIQHTPPQADLPIEFMRIKFTWDQNKHADDPQWERLTVEQVEELTGESLAALNRRLGDVSVRKGDETNEAT